MTKIIEPLPCLVCKKPLRAALEGQQNHPMGNVFVSRGNYGSTVWDPMDGGWLEVNVCDPCLVGAASAGRVLRGRLGGSGARQEYESWVPPENTQAP